MGVETDVGFWNDDRIVDGVLKGDQQAISQLLGKYAKRLWGFLVRDRHMHVDDADEAMQVVVERAIKGIHTFERGKPLFTWLAAIAKNVHADVQNGKVADVSSKRPNYLEDHELDKLPLHKYPKGAFCGDGATKTSQSQREIDALREVLSQLGESDQRLLEMELFMPITRAEMAESFGVNTASLRTRICRAQKRFISALQDHPEFRGRPVNPDWSKDYVK